jgi:CPA1 family monovalent cation:H+ antiporter
MPRDSLTADINQLGLLLLISALVAILTRRLRLPYTVGLVLTGMTLSFFQVHLHLHLSRDLVFSVFLPPLIFEAALCISWRKFKADLPVVALLATVGVLLAAFVTAAGMHYLLGWNIESALIFGVLISATDPVSVIATFKNAEVQGRLRLLIETESLLNDGTAAVVFVAVLGVLAGTQRGALSIMSALVLSIGGGVIIGAVAGLTCVLVAERTDDPLIEMTLTTLAAYGSFAFAERFHCSGVLAALAAGLVVGNFRVRESISQVGRRSLEMFWEYAAFIANSLIFILIGVQVAEQRFDGLWIAALVAIVLVLLGRAATVYPLCAVFDCSARKVDARHQFILFWGGLRGALALALALALPVDLPQRQAIVTVTFAVVAFSVFAQGLTMPSLLRRLGQLS